MMQHRGTVYTIVYKIVYLIVYILGHHLHGVYGSQFGGQANVAVGVRQLAVRVSHNGVYDGLGDFRLDFQQTGIAGMTLAVGA